MKTPQLRTATNASVLASILVLATVIAGWSAPAARAAGQQRVHLARALAFEDTGDLPSAIIEYRNVLQMDPNNLAARVRYARLLVRTGQLVEGRQNFEQALQRGAPRHDLLLDLGEAYLRTRDYQRLLEFLPPGAGRDPQERARVLVLRGLAQTALGDYAAARLSFDSALVHQPGNSSALVGLGKLAAIGDDLDQIRRVVEQSRELDSNDPFVWVLMGQLEQQAGNFEQAAAAFDKALATDPKHPTALLGMMLTRFVQQRYPEARDWADRLLLVNPRSAAANLVLARIAVAGANLPAARDYLRLATDAAPDYGDALLLYASVSYDLGEFEHALRLVKRFLATAEDHLGARKLLALAQLGSGEPEQALWGIEPLLARYPEDAQLLALAITAAIQSNKPAQARAHADSALGLDLPATLHARFAQVRAQLADEQGFGQAVSELQTLVRDYQHESRSALIRQAIDGMQRRNYTETRKRAQQLLRNRTPDPAGYLLEGLANLAAGNLDASRTSIDALLELQPDNLTALNTLAHIDLLGGDLDAARARYQRVTEIDPKNFDAIIGLARVASGQGQRDQAVSLLERARREFPTAVRPRLLLGWIYLREHQTDLATTLAGELGSLAPDDPQVLDFRGFADAAAGKPEQGLAKLEAAAAAQPDSVATLYRLAMVQVAANRRDDAVATYQKILALDPGAERAAARLVQLAVAAQRYDQALEAAQRLEPHRPAFAKLLEGDLYRARGDRKKALDAYLRAANAATSADSEQKARSAAQLLGRFDSVAVKPLQQRQAIGGLRLLTPESREVDDLEGRFLIRQGEAEAAVLHYRRLSRQDPDDGLWVLRTAEAQRLAGDKLAALKVLRSWLERHPRDTRMRLALAAHQLADGATMTAADEYLRIVEIDPDNPVALNNAAWLNVDRDPARALEHASRAAAKDPNPQILHTLGRVLRRNHQPDQAIGVLRRAWQAAPDQPDIGYELAAALAEAAHDDEAKRLLGQLLGQAKPFKTRAEAETLLQQLTVD